MCALKSATANPLGLSTFEKEHAPEAVTVPIDPDGFQNPVAVELTRAIGLAFCPRSLPVVLTVVFPSNVALLDTARVSTVRLEIFTVLRFVVPPIVRSLLMITVGASIRISPVVPKVICEGVGVTYETITMPSPPSAPGYPAVASSPPPPPPPVFATPGCACVEVALREPLPPLVGGAVPPPRPLVGVPYAPEGAAEPPPPPP